VTLKCCPNVDMLCFMMLTGGEIMGRKLKTGELEMGLIQIAGS